MPGTVSYINNEPVWVVFNSVMLGLTEPGGATLRLTPSYVTRNAEQTGDYALDKFFTGMTAQVDVVLSEIDNEDNWIVAFPHAEKQVDTNTPPATRVVGNSSTANAPYVGQKATSVDAKLILRPQSEYVDAATEETGDFVLPMAFCENVGDITFALKEGNTLPLTFTGLFNPSASTGENLWFRGLEIELSGAWTAA